MKRNILNSPRLLELKKHRRKVFWGKIALAIFALLAIFSGLAFLSRVPSVNIHVVEIIGNKVLDGEVLKAVVEKEIAGNYLWFFPKTNILIYPKNKIARELQDEFPRIKNIDFSINDKQSLEVSLTERVALYTWCGVTPPDINGTNEPQCSFLDDSGYIFDEAPYFSGEVYFKFYGSLNSGGDSPLKTYFYPVNFTKFTLFKKILESMGLVPVSLYADDAGDAHIFLARKTMLTGPEIMFKTDADLETVAENLQAALSTEPLLSNFKNKYSSLLYIDLRFGNKVYYKFK
ncbi:MAG: hypothetical protein V4699_03165 [Patescibacteria group bacterium]